MRKVIPFAVAVVIFLVSIVLIRPEPSASVVMAAIDLPAGHVILPNDVALQDVPERFAPVDAFTSIGDVIGQQLRIDRTAGDMIRASNLGEPVRLKPDERAVAVHVSDSAGIAGLIQPGDIVGVVAAIRVQSPGSASGTFSKATIEPLRVLYLSPEFVAHDPGTTPEADPITGLVRSNTREQEGTVVLAVPTDAQVVLYDFSGREAPNQARIINAIELLAALEASANASLSLYLVPEGARQFASSGLFLPDLVITPGPTPTPTVTPEGFELTRTAIPTTPTVEAAP